MFTEIVFIDPVFWDKGKSDKPISTIFWLVCIVIVGILWQFIFYYNWALSVIFLAVCFRFGLFDYIYNLIMDEDWKYLGKDATGKLKTRLSIMRFPLEAFLILVAVMQYLYFNCNLYCDSDISILFNLPRFK